MEFINRETELKQLQNYSNLSKERLMFTAISGLRRVGKTTLVEEFIKEHPALFFFIYETKTSEELLGEFTEILRKNKVITELENLATWQIFFETLFLRCQDKVIIFDEFQNFYDVDRSVFSILQRLVDQNKNTRIHFIILGSIVSLFRRIFEDKKEPLYGRISASIILKPFKMKSSFYALEKLGYKDIEKKIIIYSIFGGFPKYYATLEQFNLRSKEIIEIIDYLFIIENAPLESEVPQILKQEFGKRSSVYYAIVHAIAIGKNKLNEIAGFVGVKESSITRHLSELEEKFDIIVAIRPFGIKKMTRYKINHPLIRFWFMFIYEKFSEYSLKKSDDFLEFIGTNLNNFIGRRFEEICCEFLIDLNSNNKTPFVFEEISNWWGSARVPSPDSLTTQRKEIEIDLIALNKKERKIAFIECKWQNKINPLEIAQELTQKAKFVNWNFKKRKEIFIIIARSFTKKISQFEGNNVVCYDLDDFEKVE